MASTKDDRSRPSSGRDSSTETKHTDRTNDEKRSPSSGEQVRGGETSPRRPERKDGRLPLPE